MAFASWPSCCCYRTTLKPRGPSNDEASPCLSSTVAAFPAPFAPNGGTSAVPQNVRIVLAVQQRRATARRTDTVTPNSHNGRLHCVGSSRECHRTGLFVSRVFVRASCRRSGYDSHGAAIRRCHVRTSDAIPDRTISLSQCRGMVHCGRDQPF